MKPPKKDEIEKFFSKFDKWPEKKKRAWLIKVGAIPKFDYGSEKFRKIIDYIKCHLFGNLKTGEIPLISFDGFAVEKGINQASTLFREVDRSDMSAVIKCLEIEFGFTDEIINSEFATQYVDYECLRFTLVYGQGTHISVKLLDETVEKLAHFNSVREGHGLK